MSSEKFEELDDEVDLLLDDLQRTLKSKLPKLTGEQRKAELRKVDCMIDDAVFSLEAMTDEAEMAPMSFRSNMMTKVKERKAKLDKLKKDLAKNKGAGAGSRGELLGDPRLDDPMVAQRNRIMDGLESLERTSASVTRSKQVANETTEIGVGIISDLGDQRESLIRIRGRIEETDTNLSKSRRILNTMAIRVATNKIILIFIIILELAILGAVVYVRFFKK